MVETDYLQRQGEGEKKKTKEGGNSLPVNAKKHPDYKTIKTLTAKPYNKVKKKKSTKNRALLQVPLTAEAPDNESLPYSTISTLDRQSRGKEKNTFTGITNPPWGTSGDDTGDRRCDNDVLTTAVQGRRLHPAHGIHLHLLHKTRKTRGHLIK